MTIDLHSTADYSLAAPSPLRFLEGLKFRLPRGMSTPDQDEVEEPEGSIQGAKKQYSVKQCGCCASQLILGDGVLVTVLSPAPIRGVLRPCSGGIGFAGALDSAIGRRSADGGQFG